MSEEIFLIDTNSLITPHLTYYSFDLAPGFWKQMEYGVQSGRILILDLVKAEILRGNDDLSEWLCKLSFSEIDRRQDKIIEKYSEILQYIQNSPCYKESALTEWSKSNIADAWLIAAALVFGYTIITFENKAKPNSGSPSKNAKIPDVADYFGAKTETLFYLMRKLEFKLS